MKIPPEVAKAVDKYIDRDGKASKRIEEPKPRHVGLDLEMYPPHYELEQMIESVVMRCMERLLRELRSERGYSASRYSADEYYRREMEKDYIYALPSQSSE